MFWRPWRSAKTQWLQVLSASRWLTSSILVLGTKKFHRLAQPVSAVCWHENFIEAGHSYPEAQRWQTSMAWQLLQTRLPPLSGVKIIQRLLLPTLTHHLHLAISQCGFRWQRSTTSALMPLVHIQNRSAVPCWWLIFFQSNSTRLNTPGYCRTSVTPHFPSSMWGAGGISAGPASLSSSTTSFPHTS